MNQHDFNMAVLEILRELGDAIARPENHEVAAHKIAQLEREVAKALEDQETLDDFASKCTDPNT